MRTPKTSTLRSLLVIGAVSLLPVASRAAADAGAPPDPKLLETTLTPLGAERAGNADGSIPAWTGGLTTSPPGFKAGGRRLDLFPDEKPLFAITGKNMDQYAAKLTEGVKALLKKYPDFRLDVYPTHRTAAAPQWVYDNTRKNVTRAKLVAGSAGPMVQGAYGGVPFPIPRTGAEVMWNHQLRWRGTSWHTDFSGYLGAADGKRVWVLSAVNDNESPYYFPDGSPESFSGWYWRVHSLNTGPAIRAGEAVTARSNLNPDKDAVWVYLTGQRRVRKMPNACCDTPTPFSAGVASFDEVEGFSGKLERFDWTLVGKREIYIPYATNKTEQASTDDVLKPHFLNPDHVRWELHRVWVVEAKVRAGTRHLCPRSLYYIDEDSWLVVLSDRWDAKDQLWRLTFSLPLAAPDIPAVIGTTWGFYDLVSGTWFVNVLMNDRSEQYKVVPRYSETVFSPEAMAGEGLR